MLDSLRKSSWKLSWLDLSLVRRAACRVKRRSAGSEPGLLLRLSEVSSQLEDLGSEILQDSRHVDGSGPLVSVGQRVVA